MNRLKAVSFAVLLLAVAGIRAQPPGLPVPPLTPIPPAPMAPGGVRADSKWPALPMTAGHAVDIVADLRVRYVKVNGELVNYLTSVQLKQRVEELEAELREAKERDAKAAKEGQAAAALAKVRATLGEIAQAHRGTEAGAKAQQAFELTFTGPKPPLSPSPPQSK